MYWWNIYENLVHLFIAILSETVANTALKASEGLPILFPHFVVSG